MATEAGSTHPIRMHSCYWKCFLFKSVFPILNVDFIPIRNLSLFIVLKFTLLSLQAGIAAVQLALGHGCIVLGTAGTQEGMDLVKSQGAHGVFNHREQGYVDKIQVIWRIYYFATSWEIYRNALVKVNLMFKHSQDFVGGKGVNMIVEMRTDTNMDNDVKLLAKFGRIMVCKL